MPSTTLLATAPPRGRAQLRGTPAPGGAPGGAPGCGSSGWSLWQGGQTFLQYSYLLAEGKGRYGPAVLMFPFPVSKEADCTVHDACCL